MEIFVVTTVGGTDTELLIVCKATLVMRMMTGENTTTESTTADGENVRRLQASSAELINYT